VEGVTCAAFDGPWCYGFGRRCYGWLRVLAVQAYMAMRLLNAIAVEKCGQRAYQAKGAPTFVVDLRMLKVKNV